MLFIKIMFFYASIIMIVIFIYMFYFEQLALCHGHITKAITEVVSALGNFIRLINSVTGSAARAIDKFFGLGTSQLELSENIEKVKEGLVGELTALEVLMDSMPEGTRMTRAAAEAKLAEANAIIAKIEAARAEAAAAPSASSAVTTAPASAGAPLWLWVAAGARGLRAIAPCRMPSLRGGRQARHATDHKYR